MTVVDVTQWYSPVSGGIRTYLRAKARWAAANGRAHGAVVTGDRGGSELVAASVFARVRGHTPARRWGYRVALRPAPLRDALEGLAPSVVVLHDALAFPRALRRWAAARGVPVVLVCHSDLTRAVVGLPAPARRPASAVLGRVQREALRSADLVLVASEGMRDRVAPHAPAPVVVSALGVEARAFAQAVPDPALRARLAPPHGRLVLYAGRLSSEKRVDLLPAVLRALDPADVLVVAGTGAAGAALARRARRLGVADRMVLLGHVSDRARLATLMATADCMVHPNPHEPFGLALLEALAAGTPVVAPRTVGIAAVLAEAGATLVAPGDAGALADGVRRAMDGPPPSLDPDRVDWRATFAREWARYDGLRAAA
ncbi:MAG: glycosyltransferase [Thermoleophilia bacterium]